MCERGERADWLTIWLTEWQATLFCNWHYGGRTDLEPDPMPQPEEKPQGQKQSPLPLSFISASCLFLLQLITPPLPPSVWSINCHQSSDLNFSCKFLVKGVPVFFLNFPLEGSIKHFMVFYRNTNCTQVRDWLIAVKTEIRKWTATCLLIFRPSKQT